MFPCSFCFRVCSKVPGLSEFLPWPLSMTDCEPFHQTLFLVVVFIIAIEGKKVGGGHRRLGIREESQ